MTPFSKPMRNQTGDRSSSNLMKENKLIGMWDQETLYRKTTQASISSQGKASHPTCKWCLKNCRKELSQSMILRSKEKQWSTNQLEINMTIWTMIDLIKSFFLFIKLLVDVLSDQPQRYEHADVPRYNSSCIGLKSFIKCKWPFFQGFHKTIQNASVFTWFGIHYPCFENINGASNHTGGETSDCRRD